MVVSLFCNQYNELEYLTYLSVLFGNKYVIKFYFFVVCFLFCSLKMVKLETFSQYFLSEGWSQVSCLEDYLPQKVQCFLFNTRPERCHLEVTLATHIPLCRSSCNRQLLNTKLKVTTRPAGNVKAFHRDNDLLGVSVLRVSPHGTASITFKDR